MDKLTLKQLTGVNPAFLKNWPEAHENHQYSQSRLMVTTG